MDTSGSASEGSWRSSKLEYSAHRPALGAVVGLLLFTAGAVVPYWDGGVPGFGPPPPAFAARRLIDLGSDYWLTWDFWKPPVFWRTLRWLAVFAVVLIAARVMVRRPEDRRTAAGAISFLGAIFLFAYLQYALDVWLDLSVVEPLSLLAPLGACTILICGISALSTDNRAGEAPTHLAHKGLAAVILVIGAGFVVAGHFFDWHSEQNLPFIWTGWRAFVGRHNYVEAIMLVVMVSGALVCATQLFVRRGVGQYWMGVGLASAAWVLAVGIPLLTSWTITPYASAELGLYLLTIGGALIGSTLTYVRVKTLRQPALLPGD